MNNRSLSKYFTLRALPLLPCDYTAQLTSAPRSDLKLAKLPTERVQPPSPFFFFVLGLPTVFVVFVPLFYGLEARFSFSSPTRINSTLSLQPGFHTEFVNVSSKASFSPHISYFSYVLFE